MRRRVYVAGIIILAGFLVFLLAPILTWTTPIVGDAYYTAEVSPSYDLLNCGMIYNIATVFKENGQVMVDHAGALWLCG